MSAIELWCPLEQNEGSDATPALPEDPRRRVMSQMRVTLATLAMTAMRTPALMTAASAG